MRRGVQETVVALIEAGTDVNARDYVHAVPLCIRDSYSQCSGAQTLLQAADSATRLICVDALEVRLCAHQRCSLPPRAFFAPQLQEQLRIKDDALMVAITALFGHRPPVARIRQQNESEEAKEVAARLMRAESDKAEQPATDDVKVGKAPRDCKRLLVSGPLPADSVEGNNPHVPLMCAAQLSVSCRLQDGRTALTVAIHGIGSKSVRT